MLPQSRLDKISEMENLLNEAESFLADAEQFLEKWQAFLPKMKTLEHYYFDGDWRNGGECQWFSQIFCEIPPPPP